MRPRKLKCIGDSHASFFCGEDAIQPIYPTPSRNLIPGLEAIRLGPVLAYSLKANNTKSKGREKLFDVLYNTDPLEYCILFCFGEIDCRAHLIKVAERKDTKLSIVVKTCVERYVSVIAETKKMGFEVYVWNVIPSSLFANNKNYPHYGTITQRNRCTVLFNRELENECRKIDIQFIQIYSKLVDKNNQSLHHFLFDGIHLGQLAMPFFLKEISGQNFSFTCARRITTKWYIKLYISKVYTFLRLLKRQNQFRDPPMKANLT